MTTQTTQQAELERLRAFAAYVVGMYDYSQSRDHALNGVEQQLLHGAQAALGTADVPAPVLHWRQRAERLEAVVAALLDNAEDAAALQEARWALGRPKPTH